MRILCFKVFWLFCRKLLTNTRLWHQKFQTWIRCSSLYYVLWKRCYYEWLTTEGPPKWKIWYLKRELLLRRRADQETNVQNSPALCPARHVSSHQFYQQDSVSPVSLTFHQPWIANIIAIIQNPGLSRDCQLSKHENCFSYLFGEAFLKDRLTPHSW